MSIVGRYEILNKMKASERKKVTYYFELLLKAFSKNSVELNEIESMELSFPTDYNRWLVVIGFFEINRQKQILQSFVTTLKANIEIAKTTDGEKPPKACNDALRIYEIHLQTIIDEEKNSLIDEKYAEMAIKTKLEEFLSIVSEYSFLSLDTITALKEDKKVKLINLIVDNKAPYTIAMLEFLGYIKKISEDYRLNNTQVYKHLHKALGYSERIIKGNLLVLNPISKEKREIYTAETYIEIVRKDYKKLIN